MGLFCYSCKPKNADFEFLYCVGNVFYYRVTYFISIRWRINCISIYCLYSYHFFSLIFYALDTRTKAMIKFSEDILKTIEQKNVAKYGNEIMIFSIEQEKTIYERRRNWIAKRFLSYSKLFRLIFLFFTLIGVLGIVFEIYNICGK